jgi:mRNA interferase HicA
MGLQTHASLLLEGRTEFDGHSTLPIDNATHVLYRLNMTSAQFKRWLEQRGCTFEPGKGGHLTVRLGANITSLPMHGAGKEIGKGLEHHIKKVLGLK